MAKWNAEALIKEAMFVCPKNVDPRRKKHINLITFSFNLMIHPNTWQSTSLYKNIRIVAHKPNWKW